MHLLAGSAQEMQNKQGISLLSRNNYKSCIAWTLAGGHVRGRAGA